MRGVQTPAWIASWGKNLLLAMVAVRLPAAAMEVGLRCLPKFSPLPRIFPGQFGNHPQNSYLTEDAVIGWRLKPNRRFGAAGSTVATHRDFGANGNSIPRRKSPRSRSREIRSRSVWACREEQRLARSWNKGFGELRSTISASPVSAWIRCG